MTPSWGDYNNDGHLDLFDSSYGPAHLYKNNGNGTFADVTGSMGVVVPSDGRGTAWGDYNNDGYLDLFLGYPGGNHLLRNKGNETFEDVTATAGENIGSGGNTHPVAWVDYNSDGYLDLCFSDANIGLSERIFLFRNNGIENNHWLAVKTNGVGSNNWGIGARVTVESGGIRQIREVQTSSGYTSQSGFPVFFGMNGWMTADVLTIRWPSGIEQQLTGVGINQMLTVTEPPPPPRPTLTFIAASPVDLVVTDPLGRMIDKETNDIPGATYAEEDLNGDGDPDDQVEIPNPEPGYYQVVVVPEPDVPYGATYTLTAEQAGRVVILANNAPVPSGPKPLFVPLPFPPNFPPVADAGPDITVACTSCWGTPVQLDGTRSYDPDGDPLSFGWYAPPILFDNPASATPTGDFPLGKTWVGLTVSDPDTLKGWDSVNVTVIDTLPPSVEILTPAWGDLFVASDTIDVNYTAFDICADSLAVGVFPSDPIFPILDLGSRMIRVTAKDYVGNVGSDSVQVEVIPQVSVGITQGFKGGKTPVPLGVDNASGLVAAMFQVSYDKDKFVLDKKEVHTTLLTVGFLLEVDEERGRGKKIKERPGEEGEEDEDEEGEDNGGRGEGQVTVAMASDTPLSPGSGGTLLKLPFEVKKGSQVSVGDVIPLTLTDATLVYDNGSLRTFIPATVDGHLEVVEGGMAGDVNQSGVWDLEDVVLILRVIVDMTDALSPLQEALADADENHKVELRDALAVLRSLVREKLVPSSPWVSAEPVIIEIPPVQTLPGQRVSIPIRLEAAHRVYGMDLRLRYDPGVLHLDEISHPGTEGLVVSNTQTPGIIHLVGVSQNSFKAPGGDVIDLTFHALALGAQQVRLEQGQLLGANSEELPVQSAGEMLTERFLPKAFSLFQNYPNPFNPETVIRYELPASVPVRITIYNLAGQKLETLVHGHQEAGRHQVIWKADNYAPGVYLFHIEAGKTRKTMKMVLVK